MNAKLQERIQNAVVQLSDRGRGTVVSRRMIVTAAHVCVEWSIEGGMAHGDPCLQEVLVGGRPVQADILAIEPRSDIAVLGAPDDPQLEEAYDDAIEALTPVAIHVADLPLRVPVPVRIYTHQGRWVTAQAIQHQPNASHLALEASEGILSGTSGSPVVTEQGRLLGPVSISGGLAGAPPTQVTIPRLHLTAPRYLVRWMRNPRFGNKHWRRYMGPEKAEELAQIVANIKSAGGLSLPE